MPNKKKLSLRILLLALATLAGETARPQAMTEEFLTITRRDSADLIWNFELGTLHPPLMIYDWDYDLALPAPQNRSVDVGTGAHGAFDASTYAAFDEDGNPANNVIVIDTDQYPDGLNVTRFTLDAGITLSPVGSNPLVIKSLSDIVIAGTINCSGGDGGALNADITALASGGQGRCGGGDGGNGGTSTVPAEAGSDVSVTATGGTAGGPGGVSGGIGGGGGGAYNLSGAPTDNGENPNVAGADDGGAAGALDASDAGFGDLSGGAGGGGGSASTNGIDDARGGGGGAGGGVIVLMAVGTVHIENTGLVLANGGGGGGGGASLDAGGGGGGGGGSIAIFAGTGVINDAVLGVSTDGGVRGLTTNLTNGGSHGGNGVTGRIWMTDADAALAGTGSEPGYANTLIGLGSVLPEEGTFTAQTKGIELFSSIPVITAVNLVTQSSAGNTVTVEFASGESSGFNPAGLWIDSSLYVGETAARFLKFRVTLTITDRNQAAAEVGSVAVTYDRLLQTKFDFKAGGCGRIQLAGTSSNSGAALALVVLFLPLLTLVTLRRGARKLGSVGSSA